jgi:hypothetical protein
MAKWLGLVTTVAMIAGCDNPAPTVPVAGKLVDRAYVMSSCVTSRGEEASRCESYVAGLYYYVLDSARLSLRADGTASWQYGEHRCSTEEPCVDAPPAVVTWEGTYRFARDSVLVTATNEFGSHLVVFTGPVPEGVPEDWAGPDGFSYRMSTGFVGVFKPTG